MARRLSGSSAAAGLRQTFSTTHSHTTIIVLLCACCALGAWRLPTSRVVRSIILELQTYRNKSRNDDFCNSPTQRHIYFIQSKQET